MLKCNCLTVCLVIHNSVEPVLVFSVFFIKNPLASLVGNIIFPFRLEEIMLMYIHKDKTVLPLLGNT